MSVRQIKFDPILGKLREYEAVEHLLNNNQAGRAPLPTDDETEGYEPRSKWYWIDDGRLRIWTAISVAEGEAVWNEEGLIAFSFLESDPILIDTIKIIIPSPMNVVALIARSTGGTCDLSVGDEDITTTTDSWTTMALDINISSAPDVITVAVSDKQPAISDIQIVIHAVA